jgi:hypothetical protein
MNSEPSLTVDPAPNTKPTPRWLSVSRQRAFLTHLLCSALVVGIVFLIAFFVWYPGPYWQVVGAWRPLRVLVGVDLVLGPLLTLLLFKPGKKGLLFDLSCILAVQLVALIYGAAVIYSNRPYFDVFAIDRFVVLSRSDVDAAEWAQVRERVGPKPLIGPVRAFARLPTTAETRDKTVNGATYSGNRDIEQTPALWSPYQDHLAQVIARIKPLSVLKSSRPEMQQRLAELPARLGLPAERVGFLPALAGTRATTLVLDTSTGAVLDVLDKDPWEND